MPQCISRGSRKDRWCLQWSVTMENPKKPTIGLQGVPTCFTSDRYLQLVLIFSCCNECWMTKLTFGPALLGSTDKKGPYAHSSNPSITSLPSWESMMSFVSHCPWVSYDRLHSHRDLGDPSIVCPHWWSAIYSKTFLAMPTDDSLRF